MKSINTVYTLHGQVLQVVTSARYSHIDRITASANRTLGYIRRNIKTKNQKVRETAYNTVVRPQLEYSASVRTCRRTPPRICPTHTLCIPLLPLNDLPPNPNKSELLQVLLFSTGHSSVECTTRIVFPPDPKRAW